jgi:proton-dependent oligopeptide transporter, POT family
MDAIDRKPVATTGSFDAAKADVSTYRLVGPQYFMFFAWLMGGMGVLFVFVASLYREKTHLRDEEKTAA